VDNNTTPPTTVQSPPLEILKTEARRNARRGFRVVLLHSIRPDSACTCERAAECGSPGKHPRQSGWQELATSDPDGIDALLCRYPESNLGLVLENGLVDIDFDSPEAARAGRTLLPATGMLAGRESAPASHAFYRCPGGVTPKRFSDPVLVEFEGAGRVNLVEVRVSGQTVVSPSRHRSGESYRWDRDGDPAEVDGEVLVRVAAEAAAAGQLGRYWRDGIRHDASLCLAGWLLRNGWAQERIEVFIRAVCNAGKDPDVENRLEAVRSTVAKAAAGGPTMGLPRLVDALGPVGELVTDAVASWLKLRARCFTGARTVPGGGRSPGVGQPARPRHVSIAPYVPFPTHCLPGPWAAFVRQGAASLKCDEALVALPLLAALAAAIGNTRRVYLGGEWFEPAVLWTCAVAESGGLKSPAADLSINQVKALQKRLVKEYKDAKAVHETELAALKQKSKAAAKAGEGPPPESLTEPAPPILKRVLVGDVTVEKLAGILDDNRRGVLAHNDELTRWFASFSRYRGKGGGSDEPHWLSMHRADAIVYDRKSGDKTTIFVPHAVVSVTGGIQPGTLVRLLTPELLESGLAARVLFAMPPRRPKCYCERAIDEPVLAASRKSLDALFALAAELDDEDDLRPVVVKLSPEAQARWKDFVNRWGERQYQAEGALASALAKLEGFAGRYALVHHVTSHAAELGDADPIGLPSLDAGIELAGWFAGEAERVYALLGETAEEREVRSLVDLGRRLAERSGGLVTVKMLQRSNGRRYRTKEVAEADLDRLVGLGLADWEDVPAGPRGGRPTRGLRLRPTPDETDETDREDGPPDDGPPPDGPDDTPDPPDDTPGGEPGPTDGTIGEPGGSAVPPGMAAGVPSDSSGVGQADPADDPGAGAEGSAGPAPTVPGGIVGRDSYTLVTTAGGLAEVVAAVRAAPGPVGIDIETTGLDPRTDRVRLIQLAVGADVFLIDLFRFDDPSAALAGLFEVLGRVAVVGHHLQFDLRFLAPLGFTPGRAFCTMVAAQVLHHGSPAALNPGVRFTLADVAGRQLGRELDKSQQKSDWSGELTPEQLRYAAADARVLAPLAESLREALGKAGLAETAGLEMRALPGVAWAAPVEVDTDGWARLAAAAGEQRDQLAARLAEAAPAPDGGSPGWNWNSPRQIKGAFGRVGVDLPDTRGETLATVDHPLAEALRKYKAAAKRAGTYGQAWLTKHVVGGTVLPSWHQLGAGTGRMSCSDPNLQQVPREAGYRGRIRARPGHKLVKADYSQIELRAAAAIADDGVMIEAFRAGRDLHALTAAALLDKPVEGVEKADRQLAKAVNFGLLFGMGWRTLRTYARTGYGVEMSDEQAKAYREKFLATYPGIARWHRRVESQLRNVGRHHFTTVTRGGRRRVIAAMKRGRANEDYPNKTEALNTPVQGTAADGMKDAIALLWERRSECPGARPVLFVHDEIVVEAPEAEVGRASAWLERAMVDGMAPLIDPVPVEVEVTDGRTWGG
jgi:DNA polymerase I-like protein with 3'-5' exonuclease and polymerase domains